MLTAPSGGSTLAMTLPLSFSVFRFDFQSDEPPALPAYAGSAWRGALGHALKRTVCIVHDTPCPQCLLYRSCTYPYVFETPPPPDSTKMRRYQAAPHPFVLGLQPPEGTGVYRLDLTLFGKANQLLPYFVHALAKAGKSGVGKRRQVFRLQAIYQAVSFDVSDWRLIHESGGSLASFPSSSTVVPKLPEALRIELTTPLRIKRDEHLVTPETFRFSDLFGALLRRISMLSYFHGDTPLDTDFSGLTRMAQTVKLEAPQLHWHDWTRYSSRQKTTMEMGGLLGHFELSGADLAPFWPYLWTGQWTHAGKGTSMGLGQYRIHPVRSPKSAGPA